METLIEVKNISKAYPGVQALENICLKINKGEIHAIVGENGAGKSTLMKILSGSENKDKGNIIFENKPVDIVSTKYAQSLGIAIVHQELNLLLNLGIHQNIFLSRIPVKKFGFVDWRKLFAMTEKLLQMVELSEGPATILGTLSIAKQQLIDITKALSFNSKLIIMDEPSSALNEKEVIMLFRIINNLKAKGVTIIYISHRLEEVFTIADRITVMRDGQVVGTKNRVKTTHQAIVKMMTGKTLKDFFSSAHSSNDLRSNEIILEVKNISDKRIIKNINFQLHKGELLGIAGLEGSGRTELLKAIFGANKMISGEIYLEGNKVKVRDPNDAVKKCIALLPEDRKLEGLLLDMNVKTNITLVILKKLAWFGWINRKKQKEKIDEMVKKVKIKLTNSDQLVKNLSGGNQQKVVVSKWLLAKPKVLLLDDPTRGIDVGSKHELYRIIRELANQGIGVIFVSSELSEVLHVSDRVLVIRNGKIISDFDKSEINEERIMFLVTGGKESDS